MLESAECFVGRKWEYPIHASLQRYLAHFSLCFKILISSRYLLFPSSFYRRIPWETGRIGRTKDGPILEDRALGIYPNSVFTLYTLVYDVIGCSIGFKFKQSTLKLYLSNKLIIVGAKNGGKITTRL